MFGERFGMIILPISVTRTDQDHIVLFIILCSEDRRRVPGAR
jgi:hypothetical protein